MKRLPYLHSHLRRLNPEETREKRKFFLLFVLLCISWSITISYIVHQERDYASERLRVVSDDPNAGKTLPASNHNETEALRFTF